MEPWTLIEQLARELGVKPDAFRKWRRNGVPRIWRLTLVDRAAESGIALDRQVFDQPPGRRRPMRAA